MRSPARLPPPTLLRVLPESIPDELKARDQWVCWREEPRLNEDGTPSLDNDGVPKLTKPPRDPRTGRHAEVDEPATWVSYTEALMAYDAGEYDGIGYVMTADDPYVGVDLDHCRDLVTGDVALWAQIIIDALDTYTEISPSGEGLRLFARAALPVAGRSRGGQGDDGRGKIEMYAAGHYLTVTGHRDGDTASGIEDREDALRDLYATIFGELPPTPELPATPVAVLTPSCVELGDEELIERARRAADGVKFSALFDHGDRTSYGGDASAADMALCGLLAFWTCKDAGQMNRVFRRSGLMRAKWDEKHAADGSTYGELTVRRAISGCTRIYELTKTPTRTHTMREVLMTQTSAPSAREVQNFPTLTVMTGGLRGLWVIGGAPKSGKSTLATNIVANVACEELPVLYLDLENDTGPETRVIGERIESAYGSDAPALDHLYGFRRLADLEAEAAQRPGALIVIDHLQLLARGENAKTATDAVIHRFVDWVGQGFTVLALSQVSRASYGRRPMMSDFKESGGIEAAAAAAMFVWRPSERVPSRVTVVGLRHSALPPYELEMMRQNWKLIEGQRLAMSSRARLSSEPQAPKLTPVQQAVAKLGGAATTAEILRELRLHKRRKTGERRLQDAVASGEIVRVGKGAYAIPQNIPQTSLTGEGSSEGSSIRAIYA